MKPLPIALLLVLVSSAYAMAEEIGDSAAHPDWSPDGTQLAFEANRQGARNIHVMIIDESHVRQLTFGEAMDTYPRFSPDGQRLVFLSRRHTLFSMHLIRPDGTDESMLLPADGNLEPAFSPDGQWVAFRSYLKGNDTDGEIMMVNASGENLRRLTDNAVEDGYPAFSADGRRIAFHSDRGGLTAIYVMNVDGSGQVPVIPLVAGTRSISNGIDQAPRRHGPRNEFAGPLQ